MGAPKLNATPPLPPPVPTQGEAAKTALGTIRKPKGFTSTIFAGKDPNVDNSGNQKTLKSLLGG